MVRLGFIVNGIGSVFYFLVVIMWIPFDPVYCQNSVQVDLVQLLVVFGSRIFLTLIS